MYLIRFSRFPWCLHLQDQLPSELLRGGALRLGLQSSHSSCSLSNPEPQCNPDTAPPPALPFNGTNSSSFIGVRPRCAGGRVVISKTLIPWRFCSVLCWWWTFQTPARQAFYLLQKRCFHPFSLPFPPSLPLVTGLPIPKPLGVSLVMIKITTLCTWCECVCSCTCAMPNEWRPEENFVELTLSFYLYVASGIWTQVIGLQSKHHYWAKPSHWPIV